MTVLSLAESTSAPVERTLDGLVAGAELTATCLARSAAFRLLVSPVGIWGLR